MLLETSKNKGGDKQQRWSHFFFELFHGPKGAKSLGVCMGKHWASLHHLQQVRGSGQVAGLRAVLGQSGSPRTLPVSSVLEKFPLVISGVKWLIEQKVYIFCVLRRNGRQGLAFGAGRRTNLMGRESYDCPVPSSWIQRHWTWNMLKFRSLVYDLFSAACLTHSLMINI